MEAKWLEIGLGLSFASRNLCGVDASGCCVPSSLVRVSSAPPLFLLFGAVCRGTEGDAMLGMEVCCGRDDVWEVLKSVLMASCRVFLAENQALIAAFDSCKKIEGEKRFWKCELITGRSMQ